MVQKHRLNSYVYLYTQTFTKILVESWLIVHQSNSNRFLYASWNHCYNLVCMCREDLAALELDYQEVGAENYTDDEDGDDYGNDYWILHVFSTIISRIFWTIFRGFHSGLPLTCFFEFWHFSQILPLRYAITSDNITPTTFSRYDISEFSKPLKCGHVQYSLR